MFVARVILNILWDNICWDILVVNIFYDLWAVAASTAVWLQGGRSRPWAFHFSAEVTGSEGPKIDPTKGI